MKTIRLTRNQKAVVDDDIYDAVKNFKWHCSSTGYAARWIGGRKDKKYHYLHRLIMGYPNSKIDHINGNRLDNRRTNLRLCTQSQNLRNRGANKNNKTGVKCVYFDSNRNKWSVRVKIGKKLAYLGRYADLKEAIAVRDRFLSNYHGDFFHQ